MAANTRWVVAGAVNVTLGVIAMIPALALFAGLVAEPTEPPRTTALWLGGLGLLVVLAAFLLVNWFSQPRRPRYWTVGLALLAVPTIALGLTILLAVRPG